MNPLMRRMYDASTPPPNPPGWEVVAGYIGGDTPHVWTPAEWNAQPARWRLPIWVQSDPTMNDGPQCVAALHQLGVPTGVAVALDLETSSGSPYVAQFIRTLHDAGYKVLVYGSLSTVRGNPAGDGYWIAHYTFASHLEPGSVATQYADGTAYDSNLILDWVPLWDTHAPMGDDDMPKYGSVVMAPKPNTKELMVTAVSVNGTGDLVVGGLSIVTDHGNNTPFAVFVAAAGGGRWRLIETDPANAWNVTKYYPWFAADGTTHADGGRVEANQHLWIQTDGAVTSATAKIHEWPQ